MTTTPSIDRFVATLRRRHKVWGLGLVAASHGLLAAAVVALVDMVAPGARTPAIVGAALWVILALSWAALRLRMPVAIADRELGLRDHLLTYLGFRRQAGANPFFESWLKADLEQQISTLPEASVRTLWRRPVGPLRYLVPLLVLMILLRAFAPLPPVFPQEGPPMAQNQQEGEGPGSGGSGQGDGQPQPSPSEGGADSEPEEDQPQPEQPPEQPQPPTPPQGQPPPPPPEQDTGTPEPRPLIELPTVDEFAVPEFIGEGPTRRDLVRVAQLPEGGDGGDRPAGASAGSRPEAPPAPPPEPPFDPDAAIERAVRSRHVPPHERPFVTRYFEALRKAVK